MHKASWVTIFLVAISFAGQAWGQGVAITQSGGSTDVSEAGPTSDTYTVSLDKAPANDVSITVAPDTQTDLGAGPGTSIVLSFPVATWDAARTVTVTAVDDADPEGPHTSTITHTAASTDPQYDGLTIGNVVVNVRDRAGVTVVESDGTTQVSEEGPTTDTYTLVLNSPPTADDGTLTSPPATITFQVASSHGPNGEQGPDDQRPLLGRLCGNADR